MAWEELNVLSLLMTLIQRSRDLAFLLVLALVYLFAVRAIQGRTYHEPNTSRVRVTPRGISESLWRKRVPATNPMSSRKIALGRTLFFDKRLSIEGSVSCATCHDPAIAFTDARTVSMGTGAKVGTRNTPTILNAVFNEFLFWDGRARSLEDQVKHPVLSSFEMGMGSEEELTNRLAPIPEYRRQFRLVFKSEGITIDTIAKAIAAYERTLLSGNSPFDRFITGNREALTDPQKRGWELFKGKATSQAGRNATGHHGRLHRQRRAAAHRVEQHVIGLPPGQLQNPRRQVLAQRRFTRPPAQASFEQRLSGRVEIESYGVRIEERHDEHIGPRRIDRRPHRAGAGKLVADGVFDAQRHEGEAAKGALLRADFDLDGVRRQEPAMPREIGRDSIDVLLGAIRGLGDSPENSACDPAFQVRPIA